MTESLFSPSWYRVENLKPRLRRHSRVYRHAYRGQPWYVVQDSSTGRHHRLSPAAHTFVGLMDGRRTVGEIWHTVTTRLGDDAPTQHEVIRLLGMLHAADLLLCDATPDSLEMFRRYQRQERAEWKRNFMNPLSLRIPLFDPDAFLNRWLWLVAPLFGRVGMVTWLGVVAIALLVVGPHWPDLTENIADQALAPRNLILLGLIYPLLKLLHELGHAFATKVWGGEVHEMGIVFLVLMPIPYVDASAASAFRDSRRRMIVGAAGMIVEIFVAALAFFVWLAIEPGAIRSVAHNLMLIGAVSTVLFNGNPLLRFDGYYILADALSIPNLATRSTQHIGYLFQRHLFGVRDAISPATSSWESSWLVAYGIASFVYRSFVLVAIALFIGSRFFVAGVVLAGWVVLTQVVVPAVKQVAFVFRSPVLGRNRFRAVAATCSIAATAAVLFLLLPLPSWTRAEGVIWLPEQSHVRAGTDGFVRRIVVAPNSVVRAGDPLIETEDAELTSRVKLLEARWRELTAVYDATWRSDPAKARLTREEITAVEAELDHARDRAQQAVIRSPTDGRFFLPGAHEILGRFVRQGELLGYVTDFSTTTARVVVSQAEVALVRERTQAVEVRLASRLAEVLPATIAREVPGGSDRLPNAALGKAGGGRFAVDPSDAEGLRALENLFQFDLTLPVDAPVSGAGGRVYVRFDHGSETLMEQSYRSLRRLFLRRFGV